MSDTPSSGSGNEVDIASLGIEVDSTKTVSAAENLDRMTAAADGSITAIDRLADASKASSSGMGELSKNTSTATVSNEELAAAIKARSSATVSATEIMATASQAIKNQIQLLNEQWQAEQDVLKAEREAIEVMEMETAVRQAMIMKLKDMVATFNMSSEALLRFRANQLGASEAAEPLIAQLEQMRVATERYGVTITDVSQIEKARVDWESSNIAALNAQRIRSINDQSALEESASTSLNAQRIRSLAEQKSIEESASASLNAQRIRSLAEQKSIEESAAAALNAQRIRSLAEQASLEESAMISLNAQKARALADQAALEESATTALNAQRARALADQATLEESSMTALNAQRARALADQAALEESAMTALNAQRIRLMSEQAAAEESAMAALNAQRIRSLNDQSALEESATTALNAQRIRSLAEQAASEESARTALNAQRNRALAEQVAAEKAAQEEMMRNETIFQAFKIRTMNENRAEAMRVMAEQEEAAIALAEKQAIAEIAWSAKSLQAKVSDLERLKAYTESSAIRPETISNTFSSAAVADLPNLQRYQDLLERIKNSHGHVTESGEAMGISFNNNRARTEMLTIAHEGLQGRLTKIPGSLMVLAEYTNAASLAFTGMGAATLAIVVAIGAAAYEMAKGEAELVHLNNGLALTANYAGLTRDSFHDMAEEMSKYSHGAIGTASDMLMALATSGKISSTALEGVTRTALEFQMRSGQSTEQVAAMFEDLGKTHGKVFNDMQNHVADWAAKTNDQYHYLSAAQYEHIRLLTLQGDKQQAITLLMDAFSDSMEKQDRKVGLLTASFRGWNMILQSTGEYLKNLGKDWFSGDSLEENMNNAEQKYEKLAADVMRARNRKLPDGTRQIDDSGLAKMQEEVKKAFKVFQDASTAYNDSIANATNKAELAEANSAGVESQRYWDYLKKSNMSQQQIADDMKAHAVDSAAAINRSNILKWESLYKGDKAGMAAAEELALKNGDIEVKTYKDVLDMMEAIQKKHHDRAAKIGSDGRKQELLDQLAADDAVYKAAQDTANQDIKMLGEWADQKQITRQTEYDSVRGAYQKQLDALTTWKEAETKTLEHYQSVGLKDAAETTKRLNDVVRAYQEGAQQINNAIESEQQQIVGKAVKEGTSDQDKTIATLQKQVDEQIKYNAEIGKTAAMKKQALADLDDEALSQAQVDLAVQETRQSNDDLGVVEQAVAKAKADRDQKEIDLLKQKKQLLVDAAGLEQQAAIDKLWAQSEKKLEDDIAGAIIDGGGRGWKKLIKDMETAFAKMILQPIIQPIAGSIASFLYPGANPSVNASTGGAGTLGGSIGGSIGGYINLANSAKNAYSMFSNGASAIGNTFVTGAGTVVGGAGSALSAMGFTNAGSYLSSYGAGISSAVPGSANNVLMAAYGDTGNISAGATAGNAAGGVIGSAAAVAAGLIGGHYLGGAISGGYSLGDHGQAVTNTGTTVGAVAGAFLGGPIGSAIGAVIGGSIGGLINRAFGMKDKEVTDTGMEGTVSLTGASGDTYSKWHQDGGWFRSDKDGKDPTSFDTAAINSLVAGVNVMKASTTDLAKSLGIDASTLDNYSKTFNVSFGKDGKSMDAAVTDLMTTVGNEMATQLIPNMADFSHSGETASQTLERLSNTFKQTNALADMMGRTVESVFGSAGLGSDAARESLINLAGGSDNLASLTQNYADNYLTAAEKLAPVTKAVTDAMDALGLSNVTTRDQFKATVNSLDLTTEAGREMFVSLMQLQDAFATAHPAIDAATDSTNAIATAKSALVDAYNNEAQAMQEAKDKMDSFSKTLKSMYQANLLGNLSPLTPEQKYYEARSQFDDTATKAENGDTDAQDQFQTAYQNFLSASQAVNASGDQYQKDFIYAQSMVNKMSNWADAQVGIDQQNLDAMKDQVSKLVDIDNSVLSVKDAINNLAVAMGLHSVVPRSGTSGGMVRPSLVADDLTSSTSGSSGSAQTLSSQASTDGTIASSGSVVRAIQALQTSVDGLRSDQNAQTQKLIVSGVLSNQENADTIVEGTRSTSGQRALRVMPA